MGLVLCVFVVWLWYWWQLSSGNAEGKPGFWDFLTNSESFVEGQPQLVSDADRPGAKMKQKKTTVSLLNGAKIPLEKEKKKVLAVIVENSPSARPQKGLSQAEIVYETLVEGGITRFLAIFQHQNVAEIGPVRSVRPYFVHWAAEYDAAIIHDGGSVEALQMLRGNYSYLNDLKAGHYPDAFWRDYSRKVSREHTLFTSIEGLDEVVELKEWEDWEAPVVWLFDQMGHQGIDLIEATKVKILFSFPLFGVDYEYDAKDGDYKRKLAGVDHIDAGNDQQISPENVVVLFANIGLKGGENPLGWMDVQTTGEGDAVVFQKGKVIEGTWFKSEPTERLTLKDLAGEEVVLVPGQVWIHVVPVYMQKSLVYE